MRSFRLILATSVMPIVLASCAGVEPPAQPVYGAAPQSHALRRSWMASEAKRADLIYISDLLAQVVDVYTYGGNHKLVGTLTGFFNPEGLCVDKSGDVYVTNDTSDGEHQITEYAHGSTSPLRNLVNPNGNVNGCAVDPKTGDLAVTNFWGPTEGPGGVSIYRNGSGTAISYTNPSIHYYYYCGYDNKGNLFVDGLSYGSNFGFAELPAGHSRLKDIMLAQTIYLPGGVQWDGKYMAVGDQVAVQHDFTSVIYQFSVSGRTGTEVGMTMLTGSSQVAQFWIPNVYRNKKNIQASSVIGPDQDGANTLFWKYPAGGSPTQTISAETDPIGATVSFASR